MQLCNTDTSNARSHKESDLHPTFEKELNGAQKGGSVDSQTQKTPPLQIKLGGNAKRKKMGKTQRKENPWCKVSSVRFLRTKENKSIGMKLVFIFLIPTTSFLAVISSIRISWNPGSNPCKDFPPELQFSRKILMRVTTEVILHQFWLLTRVEPHSLRVSFLWTPRTEISLLKVSRWRSR